MDDKTWGQHCEAYELYLKNEIEKIIPMDRKKLSHQQKCAQTWFLKKLKNLSGISAELLGPASAIEERNKKG